MNERPRRRRTGQRTSQKSQFPLLPLAVVAVLAGGFIIGAVLSRHGPGPAQTSTTSTSITKRDPTIAPTPQPTLEATQQVSPSSEPPQTPSPATPTAAVSEKPVVPVRASSNPKVDTAATVAPRVAPTVPAPPSKAPAVMRPRPAPLPSAPRTSEPATRVRPTTTTAPVLAGGPEQVVRNYVAALIRGDDRSANTALGRGPDAGSSFAEQEFIDSKARIASMHTTNNGGGNYTVETEVSGAKGLYFVTFAVSKTPDGYVIGEHTYIKP